MSQRPAGGRGAGSVTGAALLAILQEPDFPLDLPVRARAGVVAGYQWELEGVCTETQPSPMLVLELRSVGQ
jgi:hypothetical protein